MPSDDPHKPAIVLTQSRIALVLSIVTLLGLGFQGSKFLLDTSYRILSLEEKWHGIESTQRDVASELRNLNSSLNELNLVLREVQVRQQKDTAK
jgi:hypothetical protein